MDTNQIGRFIKEAGIQLDFTPKPAGSYAPVNTRGNVAYVAIQFPITAEGYLYTGRIGKDLTTEDGYNAAKLSAINILSQINKFIGFKNIEGLNHLDVYYQCVEDWDEGTTVANGASDLFVSALGPGGTHTRSLFGVYSFPKNLSVGVTASFTLL